MIVQRLTFGIPFLLMSFAAMAEADFPTNPQTRAECDAPAAQMRAMQERESALRYQKYKAAEAMQYATEADKYNTLTDLSAEQGKEAARTKAERDALERTCRAAARVNEQNASSALALLRDLEESYERAKSAYETAKGIYLKPPAELAQDAVNNATDQAAADAVSAAYARRNAAYSAALNNAMNDAKRAIVDLIPKSRLIAAIQNASFGQLKLHAQQLLGDWNQLESAVSVRSPSPSGNSTASALRSRGDAAPVDDAPPVALRRPGGSSGAAMFQQAISQAEHGERERQRSANEARERARLTAIEESTRVQRERERVPATTRVAQPAPHSPASLAQTCENERQKVISATNGANRGDTAAIVAFIRSNLLDGRDFSNSCHEAVPKCDPTMRGITASSPTYKTALNAWADIARMKSSIRQAPEYQAMNTAQYLWHECIARRMAVEAGSPTRPEPQK